ncbi:MAG: hypothetical protein WCK35_19545 [Chloroflexota bacterium]
MGTDIIEQYINLDFEGRVVPYDWSEADELTLAYVISVHKAHGFSFPMVAAQVVPQHFMILKCNFALHSHHTPSAWR